LRVDSHVHVWDLAARDQPWTASLDPLRRSFSLSDLAPSLEAYGIDGVVLVQTVCVAEETPELLTLAARDARVAGVVGWVDLRRPGVAEQLAALRAAPGGERLVGIRHQVQDEEDPRWLCRSDVRRGLRAVADARLVYELVVRPPQLEGVLETVAALPQLRFVLDHGAKPDLSVRPAARWRSQMSALGSHPNAVAKLSGLTSAAPPRWTVSSLRPFAETLIEAFGPQRLMFGSDWPVCLLGGGYDVTVQAAEQWVREGREFVFGDTAQRVYGLGAG